jgi:hypothetical protein
MRVKARDLAVVYGVLEQTSEHFNPSSLLSCLISEKSLMYTVCDSRDGKIVTEKGKFLLLSGI